MTSPPDEGVEGIPEPVHQIPPIFDQIFRETGTPYHERPRLLHGCPYEHKDAPESLKFFLLARAELNAKRCGEGAKMKKKAKHRLKMETARCLQYHWRVFSFYAAKKGEELGKIYANEDP